MAKSPSLRGTSHAAIVVRLVAFLVAVASVFVIPAALVVAGTGHASPSATLATVGAAAALILIATVAARRLDPLRG